MKHLLDTHVAIWWLLDDKRLPRSHRRVVRIPAELGTRSGHLGAESAA